MDLSIQKFSVANCNDDDGVMADAVDNDLDMALKNHNNQFVHCLNVQKMMPPSKHLNETVLAVVQMICTCVGIDFVC